MDNTIIFIGRPGAGKGTQAKLLAERLNARFVSAGATLREFAAQNTPVAKKIEKEINSGILVPHWVMLYFINDIFFFLKEEETIVLDGFARRLVEAETILRTLDWMERPLTVINLEIPEAVVRERIEKRRETHARDDDDDVDERLKQYDMHTAHSIEYFREHSKVIDVDGTQSIEAIADEVWEKIQ